MSNHTTQDQEVGGSLATAWEQLSVDWTVALAAGVGLKPALAAEINKYVPMLPSPIRAASFMVWDVPNNDLMNFTAVTKAFALPPNGLGAVGGAIGVMGGYNEGEIKPGVTSMVAFHGGKVAVLVNVIPEFSGTLAENEVAVNVGVIYNFSKLTEGALEKLGPLKYVGGLASMATKLVTGFVDVWGGAAILTKARFDDDGNFVGLIKDGEVYTGIDDFIAETVAVLDTFSDDDFLDNDFPIVPPATQAAITEKLVLENVPVRAGEPFEYKLDVLTGAVTYGNNSTWYEGIDGTNVTTWSDADGDNIAITYADGTVYIESADGLRTLYDASGGVVRQTPAQVEQGGSGFFKKFDEYLEAVEDGDTGAELPSFAINFSFPNEVLGQLFFPDAQGVEFATVMTSSGPARVISLDDVQYIVYADGSQQRVSDLVGEDGKLAEGVTLEQVLAGSEVLFELARQKEAEKSALQTWDTQYKAPIDKIIAQLNDPKNAIIYDTFPALKTLVDGYGVVDGAMRFSLNLASLMADEKGTDGTVSGAVDGLVDMLQAVSTFTGDDADKLRTAAFSIEAVAKAHRAFSSDNALDARLGFANDSIMALGSLAALGVVDKNFAKYAALSYGGAVAFLTAREALDNARQNADNQKAYDDALRSAVGLISSLGAMGVVHEDIVNAVRGTYAVYDAVDTGLEIYKEWDTVDLPTTLKSVDAFLSALNVLGQIGWISDEAAEVIAETTQVYNAVKAGYALSQDFTALNAANFALTVASFVVDEDNLDAQAAIAVVSFFANALSGNVIGVTTSLLTLWNIWGASSAKKKAEEIARYEATRYQLADIVQDADVDGNGTSIDNVKYEYNITDDFVYLLGEDPNEASSRTVYSLLTTTVQVAKAYIDNDYYKGYYYVPLSDYKNSNESGRGFSYQPDEDRDPIVMDESIFLSNDSIGYLKADGSISQYSDNAVSEVFSVEVKKLEVTRYFVPDMLGDYANDDIRVIYNFYNDKENWVRDELHEKHRNLVVTKYVSEQEAQEISDAMGGTYAYFSEDSTPAQGTAAYEDYNKKYSFVNTIAPIPAGAKVAYIQHDEDLGLTLFKNMNDDNGDGVLGNGDVEAVDSKYDLNIKNGYMYVVDSPENMATYTEYSMELVELRVWVSGGKVYVSPRDAVKIGLVKETSDLPDFLDQNNSVVLDQSFVVSSRPNPNAGDGSEQHDRYIEVYVMNVKKGFYNNDMEGYINSDIRVVYDADSTDSTWYRSQLDDENRYALLARPITPEEYQQAVVDLGAAFGSFYKVLKPKDGTVASDEFMRKMNAIDALMPFPDDMEIAFIQPSKNVGPSGENGDFLDKVTTFASLNGQTNGDDSTLVQLLNDKGNTYMAYALSKEATSADAPDDINYAVTGEPTMAGRALKPWGQVDIADFGLLAENEVVIPNLNDAFAVVDAFEMLVDTSYNIDVSKLKYFISADGRIISIYDGFSLVSYNSDGRLLEVVGSPFQDLPSVESLRLTLYLPEAFQANVMEKIGIITGAFKTSEKYPSVDASLLGLDITGLNAGVMNIGGVEVFGVKDYSEAPISENEILQYVSWIASQVAVDPDFFTDKNADLMHFDPEMAARAARLYVAENTPVEEFWANNELPENISFDARAYLTANPDVVAGLAGDSMLTGIEVTQIWDRLQEGSLREEDVVDLIRIFQRAATHYVLDGRPGGLNGSGDEGLLFGAYEADLNGDVRYGLVIDDVTGEVTSEIVSGAVDIVRVTSEGMVTATISGASGDPDAPFVTDYVMQNGRFLGMRRDIDGDGIAESIIAPDTDGGIWNVTLSSNGATASARTADAAQFLAVASADLQPGEAGILADVNGDDVVDQVRVLADGSGQITLGMADDTATDGYVLSIDAKDTYTGETLQDAVANTNALQLLAWTGGNEDLILAIGANVTAAQVAFARAGSFSNSLNLGQFAMENRELIESKGGDMVAALAEFIATRRVEIATDKAGEIGTDIALVLGYPEYVKLTEAMDLIAEDPYTTSLSTFALNPIARASYPDEIKDVINQFRVKAAAFQEEFDRLVLEGTADERAALIKQHNLGAITDYYGQFGAALDQLQLEQAKFEVISVYGTGDFDDKISSITGSIEYYDLGRSMEVIKGNDTEYLLTNVILLPHNNPEYSELFNGAINAFRVKRDAFLSEREPLLTSGDTAGADALSAAFNRGPVADLYAAYEAEIELLNDKKVMLEEFTAKNGLDFTFDYNMLIGERMEILAGDMADAIAANDPTPASAIALDDAVESIELEVALAKTRGYEIGTSGDDNVSGEQRYYGLDGDDNISGTSGRDILYGGDGDDRIGGLGGNDIIYGDADNDYILGGDGDDLMYGGAGNDRLHGDGGNSIFVGGRGDDILLSRNTAGIDIFIYSGGDGMDRVYNFSPTDGDKIILDVPGIDDFGGVLAVSSQDGSRTVIKFSTGNQITLYDVALDSLGADNFEFGKAAINNAVQAFLDLSSAPVVTSAGASVVDYVSLEDEVISFTLPDSAIFDADGDALTVTAALADNSALPAWLGFDGETRTFTGRPPQDFNGSIDVKITASDGKLAASDIFTLKIDPVSDAPVAGDDTGFSVDAGAGLTIAVADLLANDSDAEGDSLTITSVQNALNGAVSLNASGDVVFTPDTGYSGEASFQYTVSDGNGGTSTATVGILVRALPTAGDDVLVGSQGDDIINGREGDDEVFGFAGDDLLDGGVGVDRIDGGSGDDHVNGGDGDDTIIGGLGNDELYGDGGNDIISGNEGNDNIWGDRLPTESGDDLLDGGSGDDRLWGGLGNDQIYGGSGNDWLYGHEGEDVLDGGSGDDWIGGGSGNDIFYGGSGNDLMEGDQGNDTLNGGEGDDILLGGAGDDTLLGGSGTNDMRGDDGVDTAIYSGDRTGYDIARVAGYSNRYTITEKANPDNTDTLRDIEYVVFNGVSHSVGELLNTAPVAGGDEGFDTPEGTPVLISADHLMRNDSDADGDVLSIVSVHDALNGSVALDAAGDVVFTPATGFQGITSFSYTISDGNGGTSSASVEVRVMPPVSTSPSAGDDVITGTSGYDIIDALAGNDEIFGLAGNDTLRGGAGHDMLYGGAGYDYLYGDPGNDELYGGDGDDTLYGGDGNDSLYGGAGNDRFFDTSGANYIDGGDGWDLATFSYFRHSYNIVRNAEGSYTVSRAGGVSNTLINVERASFAGISYSFEDLVPTLIDGVLTGGPGANTINGGADNDVIDGAAGNDMLRGEGGNDTLYGSGGNDTLYGGDGNDSLYGGVGNDRLFDTSGTNYIDGGDGWDTVTFTYFLHSYDVVRNADNSYTVSRAGDVSNTVINVERASFAGISYSFEDLVPTLIDGVLTGSAGVNRINGDASDEVIDGLAGNDTLKGNDGADTLYGGSGNDYLYGGNGDDVLNGGTGNDWLYGEAGNDTFVFEDSFGADKITGFAAGAGSDDVIDFAGVSSLNTYGDVLAKAYQNGSSTVIDLDGDGSIVLTNVNLSQLHEDDFKFA